MKKNGRNLNAECSFMGRFLGYIFIFTRLSTIVKYFMYNL